MDKLLLEAAVKAAVAHFCALLHKRLVGNSVESKVASFGYALQMELTTHFLEEKNLAPLRVPGGYLWLGLQNQPGKQMLHESLTMAGLAGGYKNTFGYEAAQIYADKVTTSASPDLAKFVPSEGTTIWAAAPAEQDSSAAQVCLA